MHAFLSDEWFEAAEALREKYADQLPEPVLEIRINQVITDVPFGSGTVEAYLDTSAGAAQFLLGSLDEPDAVVMTDYETARIMIIDQDPALAMQAFMEGRVRVQGDMMKLMAAQAAQPSNEAAEQLAAELRAITA
ncbi:MAG: SCP-2 sterol transfer family protein [Acidimicrobiaceae bacterium]|nr:SCP-2 sterol transfer family protein [Acidimicrobiaceae bacterium]